LKEGVYIYPSLLLLRKQLYRVIALILRNIVPSSISYCTSLINWYCILLFLLSFVYCVLYILYLWKI